MPQIIAPFELNSIRPNFVRDQFKTLADMRAVNPKAIDTGHLSYCVATNKHYVFNPSNPFDDTTGYWREMTNNSFYVGDTAPDTDNPDLLWLDTSEDEEPYSDTALTLRSMQLAVAALQYQMNIIMNMRTAGIISGDITDSALAEIAAQAEPEIPDIISGTTPESTYEDIEPDYSTSQTHTVNHISIKTGAWEDIKNHVDQLIEGELVWCTGSKIATENDTHKNKLFIYIDGTLRAVSSGSGSGSGDDSTDMTEEKVNELIEAKLTSVDSIGFVPVGSTEPEYTVKVNDEGTLICYKSSLDKKSDIATGYQFPDPAGGKAQEGIVINSYYCGGDGDEHSYQGCSHNFVELANVYAHRTSAELKDINLNGYYLLYLDSSNNVPSMKKLKLWGTIPAGGTFLIRGAQCSVMDVNTTKIKVNTYDQQWWVEKEINGETTKELITFDQSCGAFYLCVGDPDTGTMKDINHNVVTQFQSVSDIITVDSEGDVSNVADGYVDIASFGASALYEKSQYTLPTGTSAADVIFRRWYMLDPVSQSNPNAGITAHNTKKYWTSTRLDGSNLSENSSIEEFTPKASWQGKTISTTRSQFPENRPFPITCTFGYQATDNTAASNGSGYSGNGAGRGFCWTSVGYFDEYLAYRKQGDTAWNIVESIKDDVAYDETKYPGLSPILYKDNNGYVQYYARKRWETCYGQAVTTHKVLISGLTYGVYEYKIFRGSDPDTATYTSELRKFTVRRDVDVKNFNFVQTTDQQGASWEEYEVWNLSARIMKRETVSDWDPNTSGKTIPDDYSFIINTGDICYNGSRPNEWLDYYYGYDPLKDHEEMLTVGNNDLAPNSMLYIGNGAETPWKIDAGVIDYFYAVDMDPDNPPVFQDYPHVAGANTPDTKASPIKYKIPSLYSFNFGDFHFVSLLSEMRTLSNKQENEGSGWEESSITAKSTAYLMFGIADEYRYNSSIYPEITKTDDKNPRASKVYDVEEGWLIKDIINWKKPWKESTYTGSATDLSGYLSGAGYFDSNGVFDRDAARYDKGIRENCGKCIIYIHEMPFNIISDASYGNYTAGGVVPRETAKAYLNRFHNFEYQRLFKLWGIRMVMGGHKHTCAITRSVYDAPLYYNPCTKKIDPNTSRNNGQGYGSTKSIYDDQILDDFAYQLNYESSASGEPLTINTADGSFSNNASFAPFMQVTVTEFNNNWSSNNSWKTHCCEVYNNSSTEVKVTYKPSGSENSTTVSLLPYAAGASESSYCIKDNGEAAPNPRVRIEIVDNYTAPMYIMCQATGFKNKSNSDLAAKTLIPWESFYVPNNNIQDQSYPFYTVYRVLGDPDSGNPRIESYMYQIKGMYSPGGETGSKAGYWDIAKIYNHGNTLEENRNYFVEGDKACTTNLYNKADGVSGTYIYL